MAADLVSVTDYAAIPSRGLTEETCKKWGYGLYTATRIEGTTLHGTMGFKTYQVANYRDPITHEIVGQKLRDKNKDFHVRGSLKGQLYGRHLWRDTGKRVIVTEGEIDAMSISQVLDHRWQVVSIPNGADSARKALAANLEWLNGFEEVVLCFDMDEPGRAAVQDCATLFRPGKLKVITLPLKDANAMLVAKRTEELVQAVWGAKAYRPDGLVTVSDVLERVLTPPQAGIAWCLPTLNTETFGRRYGELVGLGAGTGIGKTTLLTQQIAADVAHGHKVGVFAFEQSPAETVTRVAGQMVGKVFHVPDGSWTQDELELAVNILDDHNALHLYDHFGACEWEVVRDRIRYLRHAHDVRIFYLDHLTALAAAADDERKALEQIMAEVGGLVKELDCWLLYVSHLATPEGKSHEEGGRVTIRHFKGSRSLGYWSHFMLAMERDQQEGDGGTTLRVLKDRYTGRSTGLTIPLRYDTNTGLLEEGRPLEDKPMFNDETGEEPF